MLRVRDLADLELNALVEELSPASCGRVAVRDASADYKI
jgi:hypothetical protein